MRSNHNVSWDIEYLVEGTLLKSVLWPFILWLLHAEDLVLTKSPASTPHALLILMCIHYDEARVILSYKAAVTLTDGRDSDLRILQWIFPWAICCLEWEVLISIGMEVWDIIQYHTLGGCLGLIECITWQLVIDTLIVSGTLRMEVLRGIEDCSLRSSRFLIHRHEALIILSCWQSHRDIWLNEFVVSVIQETAIILILETSIYGSSLTTSTVDLLPRLHLAGLGDLCKGSWDFLLNPTYVLLLLSLTILELLFEFLQLPLQSLNLSMKHFDFSVLLQQLWFMFLTSFLLSVFQG